MIRPKNYFGLKDVTPSPPVFLAKSVEWHEKKRVEVVRPKKGVRKRMKTKARLRPGFGAAGSEPYGRGYTRPL